LIALSGLINLKIGGKNMTESKLHIEPGAVYSRQEAAEALGISLSTLKRLIKKGHLQVSKPGGMRRVFITGESVLEMLDSTKIEKGA
jgi:excisionase family DNA binding protein